MLDSDSSLLVCFCHFQVDKIKRYKSRNGAAKLNQDGSYQTETVSCEKGTIRPEFIEEHNLCPKTTPDEYAEIFLPFARNVVDGEERPSIQLLAKWTDIKAHHAGAGEGGCC